MRRIFLLALGGMALLAGCRSPQYLAQPAAIHADGPYVHPASGMSFPASVGDFRRVIMRRYDADGLDVSAGYDLVPPSGAIVATVYVYPAPPLVSIGSPTEVIESARATLCRGEYERRKQEVFHGHSGARLLREEDTLLPRAGTAFPGKRASFAYTGRFAGEERSLRSDLDVFCYVAGKWAFEYRFTSPESVDATDRIATFMTDLPWTVTDAGPR